MQFLNSSDLKKVSLLSLVDFSRRPQQILKRAINWANFAVLHQMTLVIGHSHRGSKYDKNFLLEIAKYQPLVRIASVTPDGDTPNLSKLRNAGGGVVDTEIVALIDIDIYPDINLLKGLLLLMNREKLRCAMAPCLYLSQKGSKELEKYEKPKILWEKYLSFHRPQFMHIAMPSSIILLLREDYLRINGFDEDYQGHGFEDFDFMIRLWGINGWRDITALDILTNDPYRAAMLGYGFRGKLARLSMQALAKDIVAMHMYHPARKTDNYYKCRVNNFDLFKKKSNHLCQVGGEEGVNQIFENIRIFTEICEAEEVSLLRYERLFDATPSFMQDQYTIHRALKRAIKKFHKVWNMIFSA